MLAYLSINPVAFHIGSWPVHWYGLMYLIGLLAGWALLAWRIRHLAVSGGAIINSEQLADLVFYTAFGAIIGGRVGYLLFYDWSLFITHPLILFKVWEGGMSFHGGLLGVIIALWFYARKLGKSLVDLTDFIAPVVPIGLGAGRIGNFINGELWGRVTQVSWAMIFPSGGFLPRHPSQLYESFLEGLVLFCLLWIYSRKPRPRGAVSALFLLGYGIFRFIVEFYREPDAHIGFLALGWMTEGQLLSLPMIILGVVMWVWSRRRAP